MKLKPHLKVKIFTDPITEIDLEGEAILKKRIAKLGYWEGRSLERWEVVFADDFRRFERNVLEPKN
jgi:hypothetical protein